MLTVRRLAAIVASSALLPASASFGATTPPSTTHPVVLDCSDKSAGPDWMACQATIDLVPASVVTPNLFFLQQTWCSAPPGDESGLSFSDGKLKPIIFNKICLTVYDGPVPNAKKDQVFTGGVAHTSGMPGSASITFRAIFTDDMNSRFMDVGLEFTGCGPRDVPLGSGRLVRDATAPRTLGPSLHLKLNVMLQWMLEKRERCE